MAIIDLKKNGFGGESKNLLSKIKTARQVGGVTFSMESVRAGDMGDVYSTVNEIVSFECANIEDAMAKNPAGTNAVALLTGVTSNASVMSEYMRALSTESVDLKGEPDSVGTSYGTEFGNVYSAESFDNQVLNDFANVSIALAYTTGLQSPGMEAIYRTVALTPEQGGVDVKVPMLFTQNPLRHAADGSPSNFGFRRLIDADIDHSILEDNVTRIIPMVTMDNKARFVDEALVEPWEEKDGNRVVTTSALAIGEDINLFGIGSLDLASRAGQANYTEALDRNIGLDTVFLNLGADTLSFTVKGVPFSRFTKGAEQGGKKLVLNFPLTTMLIGPETKNYVGEDLQGSIFASIASAGYTVRLQVTVTGDVDVERGVISINTGNVRVKSIVDESGKLVALTEPAAAAIVTALNGKIELVGYTLNAFLTNSNHRHLGLMLNVRHLTERLVTRTRSPIWMPIPTGEDRDQQILDYLTIAIQKQKEKDGITQLISYHENFMSQTGGLRGEMTPGDFEQNALPYEGVGRYVLNGYCQTVEIDLSKTQTLDTNGKIANAQTTLLNSLRSVYFDIMQTTNYENAARYIDGGKIEHAFEAALFGSDTLQRFMTVAGDSRTLGADVPHKIYGTVDGRLKDIVNDVDTLYMVMVRDSDGIDPLNSGVMLNTPSLVSTMTVTREGTPIKEVVVQPRYAHYNLCPIIVKFEVKGVHALLNETLPFKVEGASVNVTVEGGQGAGGQEP